MVGGAVQTATLSNGSATITVTGLAAGTHMVVNGYGGDGNYLPTTPTPLTLTVSKLASQLPVINAGGIVSAAGAGTLISPGGLISIFGVGLEGTSSGNPANALALPLLTTLAGTQVLVNGAPAPLLFVSPTQINCQAPTATPVGTPVQVVVIANGTSSLPQTATFTAYAPSVFTYQRAPGSSGSTVDPVITHADGSLVAPASPARPSEVLVIYATGAGKLSNPPADGAPALSSPLSQTADKPVVTIGSALTQVQTTVQYSGLTSGFVGLLQINIQLPAVLPPLSPTSPGLPSNLPLIIAFPGAVSPSVNLWVSN